MGKYMTIIAFGGLFDDIGQWLNRGLLNPLRVKYPEITFARFSWTDNPPRPLGKVGCLGHSFGGQRASDWAEANTPEFLLTLDRRNPRYGGYPKGWSAPKNVPVCKNIFETVDWLCPGAFVAGAENTQITDGTGHIGLLWHPAVQKCFEGLVK